jgi:type IV pilus assembly protein PilM
MFGKVQHWLTTHAQPIGVDFGSDCLRLAQVQFHGNDPRLIAAASADVPHHIRLDPDARLAFFTENVRDLLAQGNFRGRQAVLGLPAATMFIRHLRVPRMKDDQLRKALRWEARGKLPIDLSKSVVRHLVAGEVHHDQEPLLEVILMAAARDSVNSLLAAASAGRLDVIGMNVEPMALVDCFSHVYRRKSDQDVTSLFVDIGCSASRAMICRGRQVLFARSISIGGDHFTRAVCEALKIDFEEAKVLRIKLSRLEASLAADSLAQTAMATTTKSTDRPAAARSGANGQPKSFASAATAVATLVRPASDAAFGDEADDASDIDDDSISAPFHADADALAEKAEVVRNACQHPLDRLVEELDLCRRYYETTFPERPVDRALFVGGEARQRSLCQYLAGELGLPAQVGDPLARMSRNNDIAPETGIDRRESQPAWAVAIGLSLGSPAEQTESES